MNETFRGAVVLTASDGPADDEDPDKEADGFSWSISRVDTTSQVAVAESMVRRAVTTAVKSG